MTMSLHTYLSKQMIFFVNHNIMLLPHLPYTPDLAHYDFLFPHLKKTLKSRQFDDVEQIQTNTMRQK